MGPDAQPPPRHVLRRCVHLPGQAGQKVASDGLYLYDHGAAPGLAASKAITDEGLPTGRTDLIKDGALVGLLANHYEQQRMLNDPKGREKLGADPHSVAQAIAPRNGFRTGRGGGRNFDAPPSTTPTNLIVEGREKYTPATSCYGWWATAST